MADHLKADNGVRHNRKPLSLGSGKTVCLNCSATALGDNDEHSVEFAFNFVMHMHAEFVRKGRKSCRKGQLERLIAILQRVEIR